MEESMKNNKDECTVLSTSAEEKDCIDAEKEATVSKSHTGEEKSFDAESEQTKADEFQELIDGKYKKQFADKVHKIISRRLKEVKSLKETADRNSVIIDMLMKKFNISDGDTEKLERMIDENMNHTKSDNNKELLKTLLAENSFLKKDRETNLRRLQAKNRADKWREQAEETKKVYPDFDIEKEINNPEFARLIRAGVSVKSAYEVLNLDSILDKNSKEAEKMVVDSIRFKGNRPVENGSDPAGGILLSSNVGRLTKKQRAELAKRAARGEKIEF